MPSHSCSLRPMLIISYHLRLVLPSDLFPIRATRPERLNLLDFIILVISGEDNKSWSSSIRYFLRSHVPFSQLGPKISHGISNIGMYTPTSVFGHLILTWTVRRKDEQGIMKSIRTVATILCADTKRVTLLRFRWCSYVYKKKKRITRNGTGPHSSLQKRFQQ